MEKSYIYFAKNPQIGLVKVGFSTNLPQRFKALSGQAKCQVEFLGCVDGSFSDEVTLHEWLSKDRQEGEWFRPSGQLLDFIKRHAIRDMPTPSGSVSQIHVCIECGQNFYSNRRHAQTCSDACRQRKRHRGPNAVAQYDRIILQINELAKMAEDPDKRDQVVALLRHLREYTEIILEEFESKHPPTWRDALQPEAQNG